MSVKMTYLLISLIKLLYIPVSIFESVLFNAEVVFTIHTFIHSPHIINIQGKWNNTVSDVISVVTS